MEIGAPIEYSAGVPTTRWGDAITRLLAERGWTRRQLAQAAAVRPNTLTNIIKHGRDADLATLTRLADALKVDIAELFLTKEQSVVLHAHRQASVDRLRELVVRELSGTVTSIVEQELARLSQISSTTVDAKRRDRSTPAAGSSKSKKKSQS